MKKLLLALALVATAVNVACANPYSAAESVSFKEPESGWLKLLQLKNGNTILLHLGFKRNATVKIFDPRHELIAETRLKLDAGRNGNLKKAVVEAVHEIDGNMVVFIQNYPRKTPTLYRFVIDGQSGKLLKEEVVGKLSALHMGSAFALGFGHADMPDFLVKKDPNSDHYAVAMFNSFESDRNKRVELVLYNGKHQQVSRAYYKCPDNTFKYMVPLDMLVDKNMGVYAVARAYNTRSQGGTTDKTVIATLPNNASEVQTHILKGTGNKPITQARLLHDATPGKLALLTVTNNSYVYNTNLRLIDTDSFKTEKNLALKFSKPKQQYNSVFPKKKNKSFQGIPVDFYTNSNNTYTIVWEEIFTAVKETHRVGVGSNASSVSSYRRVPAATSDELGSKRPAGGRTGLGSVAVSLFDTTGAEKEGYFVPKDYRIYGTMLPSMYHNDRKDKAALLYQGNQYKYFHYLHKEDSGYLLFNDVAENLDLIKKGKLQGITGISASDAYIAKLESGAQTRSMAFGAAASKKMHQFALFAVSDYNTASNTLATVKMEKKGGATKARVVWMKL